MNLCGETLICLWPYIYISQAECWYNLAIHTEVYILIDLCSVEARVIISTGSTKFHPVAIFLFAYFQDGRESLGLNL